MEVISYVTFTYLQCSRYTTRTESLKLLDTCKPVNRRKILMETHTVVNRRKNIDSKINRPLQTCKKMQKAVEQWRVLQEKILDICKPINRHKNIALKLT